MLSCCYLLVSFSMKLMPYIRVSVLFIFSCSEHFFIRSSSFCDILRCRLTFRGSSDFIGLPIFFLPFSVYITTFQPENTSLITYTTAEISTATSTIPKTAKPVTLKIFFIILDTLSVLWYIYGKGAFAPSPSGEPRFDRHDEDSDCSSNLNQSVKQLVDAYQQFFKLFYFCFQFNHPLSLTVSIL